MQRMKHMKHKRLLSAVTATVCSATLLTYLPSMPQMAKAAEIVSNDFEVNYEGWYGNADSVLLEAKQGMGYDHSRGMIVSGRTTPEDGASSAKGLYLVGGKKYNYSVQVYSKTDETFHLSLLCIDEKTGEETIKELATKKVKAGEWTELSASYKAPKDSYEFRLTITTDSTNDFCFDAVSVTGKVDGATVYAAGEKGLKDEFAAYFRVGNILNGGTINNSAITANVIKDYNSIECENETKPDATLVQSQCNGTNVGVSLNRCAAIMDFCIKNNIAMRGHAFVWHSQTPSWFFKEGYSANGAWVSESTMDARLESYIKNMFQAIETQYPDLNLYAYDVVNEAVSDDSNRTANNGGARVPGDNNVTGGTSAWVQVYGDNGFIEKAFTFARKYAPEGCDLYYNDYNEYWDHKRDCIYNTCKSLFDKGLLDGVGMQSHVPANATGFAGTDSYIAAMKKYLSIGCNVQVTELDISLENGKYTLQQQADKYKAIFQAGIDLNTNPISNGRVTAICIWGPNDANSWLSAGSNALLYDSNNQPKLAYSTLTAMIPQSEWGDGSNYNGDVKPITPDENGWYFHDEFEGDTCTWQGRGAATVMTSGRTAYKGGEALLVQERESAWNGGTRTLSARAFVPGNAYSFSTNVMYFDGAATDTFYMKLQYTDANGDTQYSTVAEGTAIKGEWVQLANTNYTIPADATNMQLYVETAESTNNFYIDEAIGAVAGTVINGAGPSKNLILGDLNCDGMISSVDLTMAKRADSKGFTDKYAELAADVDQSGVFDTADIELIRDFVAGIITEFPVAERVIDTEAMEQIFSSVKLASSWKKLGENNALYTQRFGADPGFMVYKDRLYVFMTNDAFEYDSNGQMKENSYDVQEINCISSDDLVNWTDHGAIPVAGSNGIAKWAFASWAPDACWKNINGKDQFFLYFCNSAGGIGVLTADSPTGPWRDPIGKALVTKQTANCGDVEWLFDPAVFVDDDGSGYLYFGGGVPSGKQADPGTARCVKLSANMTAIEGTPTRLNPPYLFEDSSVLKIGNKYYYSYCTNFNVPAGLPYGSGEICYMTADNPLGPFTFGGRAFKNPASFGLDKGGNNHHSLVEFKGQYYLLYHARAIENRMGISLNYRSPHIDAATVSNGQITVTGTMNGVQQVGSLNPYQKVQAETIYRQAGINVSGVGDTKVTDVQAGDWIGVKGAAFTNGASKITVNVNAPNGGAIKICTGSESGTVVGYVDIPAGTNGEISAPVQGISGTQDVYFIFSNTMDMDYWFFQ